MSRSMKLRWTDLCGGQDAWHCIGKRQGAWKSIEGCCHVGQIAAGISAQSAQKDGL